MSHGGGGQPVSVGKYMRRAFRAATGLKKKPKRPKDDDPAAASDSMGVSMERTSSFSAEEAAARKESVVRVVLKGGVVEVYPGVVLACTVIRKHPPGLCLAHPDVFRNPHGAVVRPLEPLFPGQKFLLLPESTVVRLKQRIPESSVGAFTASDSDDDDDDGVEEECSDDGVAAASSEEEIDGADDSVFMAGCSAREFYVANDRWAHCQFKKLVHDGLAVEQQQSPPPPAKKKKMKRKGNNRKTRKKRKDRRVTAALAAGFSRAFAAPMRTWEPSLPSVEEEEEACSFSQDVVPQLR